MGHGVLTQYLIISNIIISPDYNQVNEKDGVQSLLSCFFLLLLKHIVSNDREEEAMELGSCWADDPSVRHAFNILLESAPMAVALHVDVVVPYFCVVLKNVEK